MRIFLQIWKTLLRESPGATEWPARLSHWQCQRVRSQCGGWCCPPGSASPGCRAGTRSPCPQCGSDPPCKEIMIQERLNQQLSKPPASVVSPHLCLHQRLFGRRTNCCCSRRPKKCHRPESKHGKLECPPWNYLWTTSTAVIQFGQ